MAKAREAEYGRGTGRPHPVDVHVGGRVRQRRTLLGLSQEKLGEAIGLTFQQVQKYERGTNRIGASRLFELSKVLDVSIAYFFEELSDYSGQRGQQRLRELAEEQETYERDPLAKRETLELVRAYYKIKEPSVRKRLFDMCKALATSVEK